MLCMYCGSPYIDNGVECETRYVWHPYYLESAPNGVCQELNELIQALRLGGTRYSIHGAPVERASSL